MKRRWKVLTMIGALAVMTVMSVSAVHADETTYVRGTRINGVDVGGMTVEQAKAALEDPSQYQLEIVMKNNVKEYIKGSEIGYQAQVTGDLTAPLTDQNLMGRIDGPGGIILFTVDMSAAYDENALNARIQSLSCISGGNIVKTEDAHISAYQEGQPFSIIHEVQGNDVDAEKTAQVIRDAVNNRLSSVNLESSGCYRQVSVHSTDQSLKDLLQVMNRCKDMVVTYTFGDVTEELKGDVISTWLTGSEGTAILVNRDAVLQYVAELAGRHDTAGTTRVFNTAPGRDVSVTGSYGWKINQNAEADALIALVQAGESVTREPVYAQTAVNHTAAEWGNTYAEVDLTGQHVYMIKDGALVWDSPCVTGLASNPDRITPPGIFSIAYKERDKVLRGKKRADGTYEYESPVSYWMPFNGGIGFHDANWRGSFGGSIYKTSGSHGCVNLPPSKAPALFDLVYKGMPVICYN